MWSYMRGNLHFLLSVPRKLSVWNLIQFQWFRFSRPPNWYKAGMQARQEMTYFCFTFVSKCNHWESKPKPHGSYQILPRNFCPSSPWGHLKTCSSSFRSTVVAILYLLLQTQIPLLSTLLFVLKSGSISELPSPLDSGWVWPAGAPSASRRMEGMWEQGLFRQPHSAGS